MSRATSYDGTKLGTLEASKAELMNASRGIAHTRVLLAHVKRSGQLPVFMSVGTVTPLNLSVPRN